jgi:GT2 family glycosyltransferase
MMLSVVVPTYRRPDLLGRCLAGLAAQEGAPAFETVVVDDGSGDATTDVLRSWEGRLDGLRWCSQPANAGPAAARNRAVREAGGDLVLFLDDDVEGAPDLVATHLRLHAGAGAPKLGVLGRVDWAPDLVVTPFMRWLDRSGLQFAYETWLREGPIEPPYGAFYTANLSMHRAVFDEVGGFDERFPYPAWEDMELAWRLHRAGFRLEYRPSARAFHTRAIDLATFRRRSWTARVAEWAATQVTPRL